MSQVLVMMALMKLLHVWNIDLTIALLSYYWYTCNLQLQWLPFYRVTLDHMQPTYNTTHNCNLLLIISWQRFSSARYRKDYQSQHNVFVCYVLLGVRLMGSPILIISAGKPNGEANAQENVVNCSICVFPCVTLTQPISLLLGNLQQPRIIFALQSNRQVSQHIWVMPFSMSMYMYIFRPSAVGVL